MATFCQLDGRLDGREHVISALALSLPPDATDEEVILAAYRKEGVAALQRLRGDWSAVIWDHRSRLLTLASDFAGIRPLYYHSVPGRVAWNSSLNALLASIPGSRKWSARFAASFLIDGSAPDSTPYQGFHPVPAGRALQFTGESAKRRRLWHPRLDRPIVFRSDPEYGERLLDLFRQSVACRLAGANGSMAFAELSGGLDSSAVTCMAVEIAGRAKVAAISYAVAGSADAPYIAAVERHCGISSTRLSDTEHPYVELQPLGEQEQPAWWRSRHLATLRLMRQRESRVLLTGQLGDLAMCNFADDVEQAADLLRDGSYLAAFGEAMAWSRELRQPVYSVLWRALERSGAAHRAGSFGPTSDRHSLSKTTWELAHESVQSRTIRREWRDLPPSCIKRVVSIEQMLESRRLQRPADLEGVDVTHPFADRDLIEFMLRIPARVTCRPGEPRKLMRVGLETILPRSVLRRRNKASYRETCMRALDPLARALLHPRTVPLVVDLGFVDGDSFRRRLDRYSLGLDANEAQFRQILLFEHWLRAKEAPAQKWDGIAAAKAAVA